MAAYAARIGYGLARRYAVPAIRRSIPAIQRFARRSFVPRQNGLGIPLRRIAPSRAANFNQIRRMGSTAFPRTPTSNPIPSTSRAINRIARGATAAAATGGALKALSNAKKRKAEEQNKRVKKDIEQNAASGLGDDVKTMDSFTHHSGNDSWLKAHLVSGKHTVKNLAFSNNLLGTQGRARWFTVTTTQTPDDYRTLFQQTTENYRSTSTASATPSWVRGDPLLQSGYLNQKFVYEKLKANYIFKNQGSSPVHMEYFIITPKDTNEIARNWQNDYVNGLSDSTAELAVKASISSGVLVTPCEYKIGSSPRFNKYWKILYSHKVRMAEGAEHEFNFTDNANREIQWNGFPVNGGQLKGMTKYFIVKIYGDIGDSSNLLGTIGTITTAPAKIIGILRHTETVRHVHRTPSLFLDFSADLATNAAALYEKDGGTGKVDNVLLEVQP
ncbi:hypothetical protein [Circovirus-like genome DCCV-5]|uniref:Uncharacterized protein n=1 Tax=Circovirus-like genome DCCV-5 TaxID=1788445 RepID=A0A190WHA9_9VIRU|nr:hypothetical protein [Circovirus-like genome DCCV-5]AMB42964.1 hypothetical protein [Circovirus-like genome DCCV-5]